MDGRALLAKYLSEHDLTVRAFAAKLGPAVPFSAVWAWARATNPRDQRTPSIDYAFAIEEQTDGAVPARSWRSPQHPSSKRASTESGKPIGRGGVVRRARRSPARQPSDRS